jgi:hypothetical protein
MGLIDFIQRRFSPSYEIQKDTYYSDFLKKDDAENLKVFVYEFNKRMKIPSAIIAVGSSTFPKENWETMKELNAKNPGLDASETYRDIDLLIVPTKITRLNDLDSEVEKTLMEMELKYKGYELTTGGVTYCNGGTWDEKGKHEKIVVPFLQIDYGLHSISTNLKNGTKLDLILGRDDLLKITAKKKIAQERWKKYAFSLLQSN